MKNDRTLEQATNVAMLPGIYKYSIVMPDGHQGYGFPIGGVAPLMSKRELSAQEELVTTLTVLFQVLES